MLGERTAEEISCARLRGERDQMVTFAVMAGAAAAGEAGKAALGMMLSDPDVTAAVAGRLLPTAVLYDLLVAPFAFWLVARVTRGVNAERAPAPEFSVEQRVALVFRSASAGAATGLGCTRHRSELSPAASGGPGTAATAVKRPRRVKHRSGAQLHPAPPFPDGRPSSASAATCPTARAGPHRAARGAGPWQGLAARRDGDRARGISRPQGPGGGRRAPGSAQTGPRLAHGGGLGRPGRPRGACRGSLARAGSRRRTPRLGGAFRDARVAAPWQGLDHGGNLAGPSERRVSRLPGKGWITAGRLAGRRAPRPDPAGAG